MKRALLFGGVPVIAGLILIVTWYQANEAASRGGDWTQVLATIESATMQPDGADLGYRYEYGGRDYRNPSAHLTLRQGSREANAARYARGRQILTYVNPSAPAESMLEPSPRPSSVNVILGVVLLIIGLPLGTYFLRGPSIRGGSGRRFAKKRKPIRKPTKPLARLKPPPSVPRK
jgi:Protein of unknown function (DUF3592)